MYNYLSMKKNEMKQGERKECETCHKEFTPGSYARHIQRKTPCSTVQIKVYSKPMIKWVGGKTQILDIIMDNFPKEMNHYHEIFLGGGSVLFALLEQVKCGSIKVSGRIHAYDLNEPLIYVYKNIQSRPQELYDCLQKRILEFTECGEGKVNREPHTLEEAMACKENYYYWSRRSYNQLTTDEKKDIEGSSLFLFLNKTCFRGVFRVGPNGFNVPYGHYPNPEIINREHLEEIHRLIQPVIFECCDFNTSLSRVGIGDFIYLDPPYAPETATSFVGYTETGFSLDLHETLFKTIKSLPCNMMMSNADVSFVRNHFKEPYILLSILCKRSIHSKNPGAKAKEVIVKNY